MIGPDNVNPDKIDAASVANKLVKDCTVPELLAALSRANEKVVAAYSDDNAFMFAVSKACKPFETMGMLSFVALNIEMQNKLRIAAEMEAEAAGKLFHFGGSFGHG